jgi:hypothetical protein
LKDVGETKKTSVVDLHARGHEHQGVNPYDELFIIAEFQPSGMARDVGRVKPESEGGFAISAEFGLLDYPYVLGTLPGE